MGTIFSGEPLMAPGLALVSAAVQPLADAPVSFWPQLLKVAGVLCAILGFLVLIQQWAQKAGLLRRSHASLIQILDTQYLGPKRALLLVQVGGSRFLLASTGEGLDLVAPLPGVTVDEPPHLEEMRAIPSPLAAPGDKGA